MLKLIIRDRHAAITKALPENAEDDKFFRRESCISSNVIDSHRTYFGLSSLNNFAENSGGRGVPLQDSHARQCPLGRTETGRIEEKDDDVREVYSIFRIAKDEDLGAYASYPSSNGFIRAIKREDLTDVSVGASGGYYVCEICDDNWYNCWHWPGIFYTLKKGEDPVECILRMEDCELAELSLVYAGSNPDAIIEARAIEALADGKLDRKTIDLLNKVQRLTLDRSLATDVITISNQGGDTMDLEQAKARITELETEVGDKDKQIADKDGEIKSLTDQLEAERVALRDEVVEVWKQQRGEKITDERLNSYKEKIKDYTLSQIRDEREELRALSIEINHVTLGDAEGSDENQTAQIDPDREEETDIANQLLGKQKFDF